MSIGRLEVIEIDSGFSNCTRKMEVARRMKFMGGVHYNIRYVRKLGIPIGYIEFSSWGLFTPYSIGRKVRHLV